MEKIKWEDLTESEQNFAIRIQHQEETMKKLKDQSLSQHGGCLSDSWLFEELGVTKSEVRDWWKGFAYVMQQMGFKFSISDDEGNNYFSNWHDEDQKNGKLLRLVSELLGHLLEAEKIYKLIEKQKPEGSFTKKLLKNFSSENFKKDLSRMIYATDSMVHVLESNFSEDDLVANFLVDLSLGLKED